MLKETLHRSDCSELGNKPYCSVRHGEIVDQQSDSDFTMRNLLARLEVSGFVEHSSPFGCDSMCPV